MPSNAQKGARSKLADVLADIKNSRAEDGSETNHHNKPAGAKRRSAVNYVALSGHTPRQSRSSAAHANHSANSVSKTNAQASESKSLILKFVDYTVDLTPHLQKAKSEDTDIQGASLYPLIREWARVHAIPKDPPTSHQEGAQQKPMKSPQPAASEDSSSKDNDKKPESPHLSSPTKSSSKQPKVKKLKLGVDTICHNLSITREHQQSPD